VSKLQSLEIPDDILADQWQLDRYLQMVADGTTPKMAVLLASQKPCGIGITSSVFLQDQRRHGGSILDQMKSPGQVDALRKGLAKNGYRLKADDQYIATAARSGMAYDPEAIVNETQDFKSLEKKVAERQKIASEQPATIKRRLAPHLVERIRQQKIQKNPDLARTDQRELRERIIDKHGTKAKVL
jgi:hypothetical protein